MSYTNICVAVTASMQRRAVSSAIVSRYLLRTGTGTGAAVLLKFVSFSCTAIFFTLFYQVL